MALFSLFLSLSHPFVSPGGAQMAASVCTWEIFLWYRRSSAEP